MGSCDSVGSFVHPMYGDLACADGYVIAASNGHKVPRLSRPLYIHLTATSRCNARCAGCINSSITFAASGLSADHLPGDVVVRRDAAAIRNLIARDDAADEDVLVCFYGGEPLIVAEKVAAVMDDLLRDRPACRSLKYMVYTNGTLIEQAHRQCPSLDKAVWLYSVSIDGREAQHNASRPGATLAAIHRGLEYLAAHCDAEVLMWSTLREGQSVLDCFEEFEALNRRGLARHFFWHFVESGEIFDDLARFAARYEDELRTIMERYTSAMEAGYPLSIVHISELVIYMLTGCQRGSTACGVELARNYDLVGGRVTACADLPESYSLGTIADDGSVDIRESDLGRLAAYKQDLDCGVCGIHGYCGGRCPVQALAAGMERMRQYCILMRLHVAVVGDYLPRIARALDETNTTLQNLYDDSAFYAQFTDVTP